MFFKGFEKISKSINDDSNQITFNKPLFDKYNSNEEEINQTIRLQKQKVDSMETVTSNCLKKINLENYNTSKLLSDHFEKYKGILYKIIIIGQTNNKFIFLINCYFYQTI